jgi:hypothetical protein
VDDAIGMSRERSTAACDTFRRKVAFTGDGPGVVRRLDFFLLISQDAFAGLIFARN